MVSTYVGRGWGVDVVDLWVSIYLGTVRRWCLGQWSYTTGITS